MPTVGSSSTVKEYRFDDFEMEKVELETGQNADFYGHTVRWL
jgi:hypothetical protein